MAPGTKKGDASGEGGQSGRARGSSSSIRDYYLDILDQLLVLIEGKRVNRQGTVMSLLESLKNSLIGKVHMPHSHLIDYGVHALTFEAVFSQQAQKQEAKESSHMDRGALESQRIGRLMGLLERLLRIYDQIDEQLHAGYYFYILTGKNRFVSNSVFVYPVVIILLGYFVPGILDYYDHFDELKENAEKEEAKEGKPLAR